MIAKLGVVFIMAVLSEEEVDGTSLLSVRGVMQDRTTTLAKNIEVIGTTSTRKHADSNDGRFYITFSGDDNEYSLDTGRNGFVQGQSDTWALSVTSGADLTKPTIYTKEHSNSPDAWIPSSIVIKKAGRIVFNANGLPAIIDGNCETDGLQWGGLFCAKSITFPFKEVNVEVKTKK